MNTAALAAVADAPVGLERQPAAQLLGGLAAAVADDGSIDSEGAGSAAWVGAALEAALRVRAPGVHASTPLVRQLAVRVGRELGLDAPSQALLDLAARVRDIGMVALPDRVLLATGPRSPPDWELVNQHPVIGAELLEGLVVVRPAAAIVRRHHERWDGGGYPDGWAGDAIPTLSRVIAICDAFVAMASDRPHRRGMGAEAALERICQEGGAQFDPVMVDALVAAVTGHSARHLTEDHGSAAPRVGRRKAPAAEEGSGRLDLAAAIAEFDLLPAFAPAYERVLAAAATDSGTAGELVEAIESDTGLTLAVLQRAQTVRVGRPIANVADAVVALGATAIQEAVSDVPRAEFPWRTSRLEVLMHRSRVHAQAVARAADRIARELQLLERDDLLAAALLHDIGKLVLASVRPGYTDLTDARATAPEKRMRQEQLALGIDHASFGGLLLQRWGLPKALSGIVAAHHSSDIENQLATYVRLADLIAHHAQGDTVDRGKMLKLCHVCGLSADALRNVLFDLPHPGGSQRRRAEPSPLSTRETAVLRILAQGKVYKVIALELGVTASTVRTHLHNAYAKLGVDDRAQAVLRATDMGWL
jgi:putative nucleotidyltransferase with HDIG domain